MKSEQDIVLNEVTQSDYKYGFYSDIENEDIGKGLSEDVIRMISLKKNEPEFMLEYRLKGISPLADHENARMGQLKNTTH
jgi:Fe-S cluster assembly protein SufB